MLRYKISEMQDIQKLLLRMFIYECGHLTRMKCKPTRKLRLLPFIKDRGMWQAF
jgi:hypothetical protein